MAFKFINKFSRGTWTSRCFYLFIANKNKEIRMFDKLVHEGKPIDFLMETLEKTAFKICFSHQSLDRDAFDISWGKMTMGEDVEEVLRVCLCLWMREPL